MPRARLACLSLFLLLTGCSWFSAEEESGGRYAMSQDAGPTEDMDFTNYPDAIPKREPIRKAGNKSPYTVLGRTYEVMPDSSGYVEEGYASWYGKKFHGYMTSNGETYDMYAMTAAHKTLPIPTYVRVTNLANNRKAVVRVNDRGPFHEGRIIDLSYAAASKLGISKVGTGRVRVEAIDPDNYTPDTSTQYATRENVDYPRPPPPEPVESVQSRTSVTAAAEEEAVDLQAIMTEPVRSASVVPVVQSGYAWLQAGAFSTPEAAESLKASINAITRQPVVIAEAGGLYKVRIGPFASELDLLDVRQLLQEHQLGVPFVVRE